MGKKLNLKQSVDVGYCWNLKECAALVFLPAGIRYLEWVAGQLGLKSTRPLSQLGPGSTRPGVFSERLVSYTLYDIKF